MSQNEPIYVTKAFLPPKEEYNKYLDKIWRSDQLTNNGSLLKEFEATAKAYLGVDNFQLVGNGTLALQLAIRELVGVEGEIITTPFSYVATTSSILWEHCTPVFVDIDPDTLCMDPSLIEAAITPRTKAILPVHVFGNPCDVEAIQAVAEEHGLRVIYDAAHAFGAKYNGKSLMSYGDVSIGSFHATKLFHTIEGGCLITGDETLNKKLDLAKRFGHNGDEHIQLGINAKASEFQAAMGLCNLEYVDENIAKRKLVCNHYDQKLSGRFRRPTIAEGTDYNYAYYPVIFNDETQLLKVTAALNAIRVFPRRYFYPSLNQLPYLESSVDCPISEDIASKILCLPLYADLELEIVDEICEVLHEQAA